MSQLQYTRIIIMKTKKTLIILMLLCSVFVIFFNVSYAKKLKINKKIVKIEVGKRKKLSVNIKGKVTWKSSNKKVATVSKKGIIKAKKIGKAKITARYAGKKSQCVVRVVKKSTTSTSTQQTTPVQLNQPHDTGSSTDNVPEIIPSVLPEPTPGYEGVDTVLHFEMSSKVITTNEKRIYGKMTPYPDTTIIVKINGIKIVDKIYKAAEDAFYVDLDFSKYQPGDKVVIERTYNKDNVQISDTGSFTVSNYSQVYTLKANRVVPTPPPNGWTGNLYVYLEEPYAGNSIEDLFPTIDIASSKDIYKEQYEWGMEAGISEESINEYHSKIGTLFLIELTNTSNLSIQKAYEEIMYMEEVKEVIADAFLAPAL